MIDLDGVRKQAVYFFRDQRVGSRDPRASLFIAREYFLDDMGPQGFYWVLERDLSRAMTRDEWAKSPYREWPVVTSRVVPLTDEEYDRLIGMDEAAEVDWRPTETIPEDFYGR